MEITAKMVQELRAKTGVGMMDCKKALKETDGDFDKAVEFLRKKGMATAAKRAGKEASEGIVQSYIHSNKKIGVLLELNCETDFVAKTDDFQNFAKDICMQVAATNPLAVNPEELPEDVVNKEKEIFAAQLKNEGKPEQIIEKIVGGKIEKYYKEVCLLEQEFVKEKGKTIKDYLSEVVAKTGEKIVIKRFVRFQIGE